jgi:hypothetical protein
MGFSVVTASCGMYSLPTTFMNIGRDVQAKLRFCQNNLRDCSVGIAKRRDLRYAPFEMASGGMMCIPSFMKIDPGT